MFDDFDDSDFADLGALMVRREADLVLSCPALGRKGARRVMFNFRPAVLDEIGGPRFNIGFAQSRKTRQFAFRIQATETGRFEPSRPGRGDRRLLRVPVPTFGFVVTDDQVEPEFFVDQVGKCILVEVPQAFRVAVPKALPAPEAKAASALDDETTLAIDRRVREMLGGDLIIPPSLGGYHFSPAERSILAALLKHPSVRREGLLAATHDPENGEDERDPKLVDVFLSKMRDRLTAIGAEIIRVDVGTYGIAADGKRALRAAIEGAS